MTTSGNTRNYTTLTDATQRQVEAGERESGLAPLWWRGVWGYPATSLSNWMGLMKSSAEWRRTGL